jgi:hypothetical protein
MNARLKYATVLSRMPAGLLALRTRNSTTIVWMGWTDSSTALIAALDDFACVRPNCNTAKSAPALCGLVSSEAKTAPTCLSPAHMFIANRKNIDRAPWSGSYPPGRVLHCFVNVRAITRVPGMYRSSAIRQRSRLHSRVAGALDFAIRDRSDRNSRETGDAHR